MRVGFEATAFPKARNATQIEVIKDTIKKPLEAPETVWSSLAYGDAKDDQLGRLDDTMKKVGTLVIATLGSLGVSRGKSMLPLWIGAASWITAMSIPPLIINGLVRLKTGVNLNARYVNSNSEIHPTFQDPNYLPLQLIPVDKRIRMAEHWGISPTDPDRPILFHNKLRQISVQAHTWWMLIAGPATPLLSALICDGIEEPLKTWVSNYRIKQADKALASLGIRPSQPEQWAKALKQRIKASIGTATQTSALSRWWHDLSEDLLKTLKLNKYGEKEIIPLSNQKLQELIARHLSKPLQQANSREGAEFKVALEDLIKRQRRKLEAIFTPLEKLFQNSYLPPVAKAELHHELLFEELASRSTLNHFSALLKVPVQNMSPELAQKTLLHHMQHTRLSSIIDQIGNESMTKAVSLAGGYEQAAQTLESFAKRRFNQAFKAMGASPMECLTQALQSHGLRQRWLRLYPKRIGGILLASTAIFTLLFVGTNNVSTTPSGGNKS